MLSRQNSDTPAAKVIRFLHPNPPVLTRADKMPLDAYPRPVLRRHGASSNVEPLRMTEEELARLTLLVFGPADYENPIAVKVAEFVLSDEPETDPQEESPFDHLSDEEFEDYILDRTMKLN